MERCLEHSQGSPEPSEPLLPPEIERKIFEMAACSHRPCIPKLIRVAKRIRIWIEPLLYRVVTVVEPHRVRTSLPYIMIPGMKGIALVDPYYIPPHLLYITAGDCLRMLESRAVSDSFFRDHILHLALAGLSENQTEHILSKCNGLVDLGLFAGHYSQSASLLPIITAMPLQRLACDLSVLFPSTGVDFNHALFSKITHLNLYQGEGLFPTSWARSLGNLPCLTHLSFDEPSLHENGAGQSFLQGVLAS
ncbi:hypothetical protein C8R43DRAFT_586550 [Mycena crocata]|nr:hypothetical protein C8R43DRAFT_586550 [Mycena crocata]